MTNLKTTIKTLSIAAAVSFSMNAMAIEVPGLGAGFDYTPGSGLTGTEGTGAIADMNTILGSFANTGGATVDSGLFFRAFIGTAATDFFDYTAAKPMIEELIYTVDGKALHAQTNGSATATIGNGTVLTFTQEVAGGDWTNGVRVIRDVDMQNGSANNYQNLSINVDFEAQGYHDATARGEDSAWTGKLSLAGNGGNMVDGNIRSSFNAGNILLTEVGVTGINSTATESSVTDVFNALNGSTTVDVDSARVVVAAYDNANDLIKLIAAENRTGNTLDVSAAASGLQTMINMHNGFLSATVREKAIELKAALRNMGIQTAASAVGQTAIQECEVQVDTAAPDSACSILGGEFSTLAGQISTADAGDYNLALGSLETYANNIIDFNTANVDGFNAADTAADIKDEFGIITSTLDQTLFGIDFGNAVGVDTDNEFQMGTGNGTGSISK